MIQQHSDRSGALPSIGKRKRFMKKGLSFPLGIEHRYINYIQDHRQLATTVYCHYLFLVSVEFVIFQYYKKMYKILGIYRI
jgi:hypothetical protein